MRLLLNALKFSLIFFLAICLGYLTFSRSKLESVQASTPVIQNSQLENSIRRVTNLSVSNLSFKDLNFDPDEDVNLYLILYSEYQKKSTENAIKGLAALEGLSIGNAKRLVESNFSDGSVFSIEDPTELSDRLASIKSTYESEKELFKSLAILENRTLALELFSNGNRDDSKFDLLLDLNDIEKVLFTEGSPSQFGDLDLSRSTRTLADTSIEGGFSGDPADAPDPDEDSPEESAPDAATEEGTDPGETAPPVSPIPSVLPPANELSCPIDPELQADLEEFDAATTEATDSLAEDGDDGIVDAPTPGDEVGTAIPNPVLVDSQRQIASGGAPRLRPFAPTTSQCGPESIEFGNLFCLRVEKVQSTWGAAFVGDEYCIACVIKKIRETTDTLMSQSISPRKVTGNFGEPAVCKNAALKAFSLNISFIPKPARPDLDLVSPIEEITPAQIRAIPTIPQSIPTQAEVLARADATAQDLSNLTSQTQLAQAIVSQQDSLRLITQSLDPEIDAITSFSEEMSLRLAAFQQNFVSLKDQLSTVRSNLLSVSQKPACSALD